MLSFLLLFQLSWRLSDRPLRPDEPEEWKDPEIRKNTKCTIFLSYTSNMISSGIRETIKFLVKNKMVSHCVLFVRSSLEYIVILF